MSFSVLAVPRATVAAVLLAAKKGLFEFFNDFDVHSQTRGSQGKRPQGLARGKVSLFSLLGGQMAPVQMVRFWHGLGWDNY